MKYIVCNSETAVLNRMYDEFEKNLEDGAVICLPENIINTQFTNRMIDDNNAGKYRYKHIIMLGQREFSDIDIEEKFGLYRYARHELFKKIDIEAKNIYYPQTLNSNDSEEELNDYREVLIENPIDVAIVFLGSDGEKGEAHIFTSSIGSTYHLDIKISTLIEQNESAEREISDEVNKDLHIVEFSDEEKMQLQAAGMEITGNKLISMGYENLMAARNLFVVVLGNDKRQYIAELFENENAENKTVLSILNEHKNLFIFTDKEASYKSEEEVNRLIKQRQKKLEIKEREERLHNEEQKKDR